MMLADPDNGPDMIKLNKNALSDAEKARTVFKDFYHSDIYRDLVKKGIIKSPMDIFVSLGADGYEAWNQSGYQGWPIMLTIMSMPTSTRFKISSQLLVTVTPGPKEPKDLESFLHPVMEELNLLARGVPGFKVAGVDGPQEVRVLLLQMPSDMLGGNKMTGMKGSNGRQPSRFQDFHGVWVEGSNHYYFPDKDPSSKSASRAKIFDIKDYNKNRRTASSRTEAVDIIEAARLQNRSKTFVERLMRDSGCKGYSLMACPSPADKAAYPHMSYLWDIGPSSAPYDVMHLVLQNNVSNLWRLFSGVWKDSNKAPHKWAMTESVADLVGAEIAAARATVPLFQARGLRNVKTHYKSYKAVEWMFFVLSTGPAALAGRIPAETYKMFMCLVRACRLIFVPDDLPVSDVATLKTELENFCGLLYKKAYGGDIKNITLCLSTVVALLDIPYNIEACGPVWSYWQFPMERYIGTLPALMRSRSSPHAALMNAVARKYRADLIASHASSFHRELCTDASGRDPCAQPEYSRNSSAFPSKENRQMTLMSSRKSPEVMAGHELQSLLKVLERNRQGALPSQIFGKKYFRAVLPSGAVSHRPPAAHRRSPSPAHPHLPSHWTRRGAQQGPSGEVAPRERTLPPRPAPVATAAQALLEDYEAQPRQTIRPTPPPTQPPSLANSFVRHSPPHSGGPLCCHPRSHGAPGRQHAVGRLVRPLALDLPLALPRPSRWWRHPRRATGRSTSTLATRRHPRTRAHTGRPATRPRRASSRQPPSRRMPRRRYHAFDYRRGRPPHAPDAARGARLYGGCRPGLCRRPRCRQQGQRLQGRRYPSTLSGRRRQGRCPRLERWRHRRH